MVLVNLDEDVPDYWIELCKIDLQLGDYRSAFDAFSRAHELDRTNIPVLAALTQLALANGQVDFAEEQARTLALVAPDHPMVQLTKSYVALQAGDLDKAETGADKLLAEALIRAGNIMAARTVSLSLLSPSASPQTLDTTLSSWARYAPRAIMPGMLDLAKAATGDRKAVFASYFTRMGKPAVTIALL